MSLEMVKPHTALSLLSAITSILLVQCLCHFAIPAELTKPDDLLLQSSAISSELFRKNR